MEFEWNDQQSAALKKFEHWFKHDTKIQPVFFLYGFAGSGKTHMARYLAQGINALFATYTGKAASVLRRTGAPASTIHSLIYKAEVDKLTGEPVFVLNTSSALYGADLLVVDECSMVDEIMYSDLMSFNVPILVLGDPGQLPPIQGKVAPFITSKPDVMLTKIHRQAEGNPIIYLSKMIRDRTLPDFGSYGESKIVKNASLEELRAADKVLVGKNATRETLNRRIRQLLKFTSPTPEKDDLVICLKNDRKKDIYNGEIFKVLSRSPDSPSFLNFYVSNVDEEKAPIKVKVHKHLFMPEFPAETDWRRLKGSQQFDFGYAITCHKAQGSQWDHVMIMDESYCFPDMKYRWLYTAVTRASERLTLVMG